MMQTCEGFLDPTFRTVVSARIYLRTTGHFLARQESPWFSVGRYPRGQSAFPCCGSLAVVDGSGLLILPDFRIQRLAIVLKPLPQGRFRRSNSMSHTVFRQSHLRWHDNGLHPILSGRVAWGAGWVGKPRNGGPQVLARDALPPPNH